MNDPFRPCRKGRGERVCFARRGWRPAKHIFARGPLPRTKLCPATGQRPGLESRGGVRRATSAVAVAGPPNKAEKKIERTVKAVKSVFAIFQLEPAAVQLVPTKIGVPRCFRWNGKWRWGALSLVLPRRHHLAAAAPLLLAAGSQKTHQNGSGAKYCAPVAQMLRQMLHLKWLIINDVAPVAPFCPNTPAWPG